MHGIAGMGSAKTARNSANEAATMAMAFIGECDDVHRVVPDVDKEQHHAGATEPLTTAAD